MSDHGGGVQPNPLLLSLITPQNARHRRTNSIEPLEQMSAMQAAFSQQDFIATHHLGAVFTSTAAPSLSLPNFFLYRPIRRQVDMICLSTCAATQLQALRRRHHQRRKSKRRRCRQIGEALWTSSARNPDSRIETVSFYRFDEGNRCRCPSKHSALSIYLTASKL